jgi:hypothetical protein
LKAVQSLGVLEPVVQAIEPFQPATRRQRVALLANGPAPEQTLSVGCTLLPSGDSIKQIPKFFGISYNSPRLD